MQREKSRVHSGASVQFNHSVMSDSLGPHGLAHQASLSITNSWSLLKLMCMSRWCHPTISSSAVPFSSCLQSPIIRVFSNESVLCIRWPKYWSFSFSISPFNEYSGLIVKYPLASCVEWIHLTLPMSLLHFHQTLPSDWQRLNGPLWQSCPLSSSYFYLIESSRIRQQKESESRVCKAQLLAYISCRGRLCPSSKGSPSADGPIPSHPLHHCMEPLGSPLNLSGLECKSGQALWRFSRSLPIPLSFIF